MEFRRGIFSKYIGLFDDAGGGDDTDTDLVGLTKKQLDEIKKNNELNNRFQWYSYVYHLSNGDITKFDKILDMNFILSLNHISYEKQFKIKKQNAN